MTRPEPGRYRHAEAYCWMTYTADDGAESELIWNSRDGVTPFVVTLRSGRTATHANWAGDMRMPEDWTPPPGHRVFTDLTEERARQHAAAAADRWLADPDYRDQFLAAYGTRDDGIRELAASYLATPGAPDLVDPGPGNSWHRPAS